jgi:hypothetical protein
MDASKYSNRSYRYYKQEKNLTSPTMSVELHPTRLAQPSHRMLHPRCWLCRWKCAVPVAQ